MKKLSRVKEYAARYLLSEVKMDYKAIAKDGQLKKDYFKYCKSDNSQTSIQGFLKWLKDDKPSEKIDEQTKEFKKYTFTVQDSQGKRQVSSIDSQNNAKTPLDLEELKGHIDAMLEIFEQASLKAKMGAEFNLTAVAS